MHILVTGCNGYVGSVLTDILIKKGYNVTGLDTNFYEPVDPNAKSNPKLNFIRRDIRQVVKEDLVGIDAIIHLAALSNDPLGEFNVELTNQINYLSSVKLANLAKASGIERFIFASSQSMYGVSTVDGELDEEKSEKNPLTAYARTKWQAECEIKKLGSEEFTVVCFRPSTIFGVSPKLRCDIVYNNFVACAYTTNKIEIKSDGTPWRPVVHVKDVCSAFIAGLETPKKFVANESFNVGIKNGNFSVRQLAEAAQSVVPGSELTFTGEHGADSRTYRVSFAKIFKVLGDYFKPEWDLYRGGKELVKFFDKINFTEDMFRGRLCNRLAQLKHLINANQLDENLYWKKSM